MSRLKILHIVHSLDLGGMENGIVNVARALETENFEMHVACLERRGVFAGRMPSPENVRVLGKQGGFSLRAVFALRREIARVRPDAIHTHNLGPLIYAALASGFGVTRRIVHGEHAELTPEEKSPRRIFQRRAFYRCCKKIHTVSRSLTEQLVALGFPASKMETIINGVDLARFSPGEKNAARRKIGLPEDGLFIGIVGRFGPFKRHALLIDAFEKIAPKFPKAHLLVVGSGGSQESCVRVRAQKSAAASRIHFSGFQNDPCPFYRAMNLLAAPSVNEGLSNAILEAMSCGIPVLANKACGNSEVISSGEDGFLADLSTADSLAAELENALRDLNKLGALGSLARKKIAAHFSLEKMAAQYGQLYREVVRG